MFKSYPIPYNPIQLQLYQPSLVLDLPRYCSKSLRLIPIQFKTSPDYLLQDRYNFPWKENSQKHKTKYKLSVIWNGRMVQIKKMKILFRGEVKNDYFNLNLQIVLLKVYMTNKYKLFNHIAPPYDIYLR